MVFFGSILALCGLVLISNGQSLAKNHATINFDDIRTMNGLANVPSTYHHLYFSSYSVLTPRAPALEGLISEYDLNCAVSSPNALLGSRPCEDCNGAYFEIANATAMKEAGLLPCFTLHSFYVKPMDAPKPGTTVRVKGYSWSKSKPLEWSVDFPSGYHLPFLVKMREFSGVDWNEIHKIEVVADFGYDALDWEFCLDDIDVQFFAVPEKEESHRAEEHVLLQAQA